MQRVMRHGKQQLCNGKNQEKKGTLFFSTVPVATRWAPVATATGAVFDD